MQMLVSLRKPTPSAAIRDNRGFTLLEVLTVLFIVGLSASLIAPNLPTLLDRMAFALQRDTLVRGLNALPFSALESNRDFVLTGDYSFDGETLDEPDELGTIDIDDLGVAIPYRSAGLKLVDLKVPEDWEVHVPQPIFYRASGFCTGGSVIVKVGRLEYTLLAEAPYCLFAEADL